MARRPRRINLPALYARREDSDDRAVGIDRGDNDETTLFGMRVVESETVPVNAYVIQSQTSDELAREILRIYRERYPVLHGMTFVSPPPPTTEDIITAVDLAETERRLLGTRTFRGFSLEPHLSEEELPSDDVRLNMLRDLAVAVRDNCTDEDDAIDCTKTTQEVIDRTVRLRNKYRKRRIKIRKGR